MRLDHGPQRQLLQVPQLRKHERLQLTPLTPELVHENAAGEITGGVRFEVSPTRQD
jgi:hypothetical protein